MQNWIFVSEVLKNYSNFASPNKKAEIAQLVEH
jgi:hypothetical protein